MSGRWKRKELKEQNMSGRWKRRVVSNKTCQEDEKEEN